MGETSRSNSFAGSYFSTQGKRTPETSRLQSVVTNTRLPEDLILRLAAVGNDEGLSLSETLRVVLEEGLAAHQKGARQWPPR